MITCTVSETVSSALKVLGQREVTFGHYKHVLFGSFLVAVAWIIPYDLFTLLERSLKSIIMPKKVAYAEK